MLRILKGNTLAKSVFSLRFLSPCFLNQHMKIHKEKKDPCTGRPYPLMSLNCKVALITGGAGGIGLAIAHELLAEKAKHVALVGLDNKKGREAVHTLNCAYGRNKAIFLNCDVQSKTEVHELFTNLKSEFGYVDIVVNAAGVLRGCEYRREILTNLVGQVNTIVSAHELMSKEFSNQGGVVLNISGTYGLKPLYPAPTLSACYHGVVGLSRSFGHERNFKKTGIRVVVLCAGITDTDFLKNPEEKCMSEAMGQQLQVLFSKVKRQKVDACAMGAVHVLKYGKTGSAWAVDASNLYSLDIPKWETYRILESQFI